MQVYVSALYRVAFHPFQCPCVGYMYTVIMSGSCTHKCLLSCFIQITNYVSASYIVTLIDSQLHVKSTA